MSVIPKHRDWSIYCKKKLKKNIKKKKSRKHKSQNSTSPKKKKFPQNSEGGAEIYRETLNINMGHPIL
jgi:hypothetical protein